MCRKKKYKWQWKNVLPTRTDLSQPESTTNEERWRENRGAVEHISLAGMKNNRFHLSEQGLSAVGGCMGRGWLRANFQTACSHHYELFNDFKRRSFSQFNRASYMALCYILHYFGLLSSRWWWQKRSKGTDKMRLKNARKEIEANVKFE